MKRTLRYLMFLMLVGALACPHRATARRRRPAAGRAADQWVLAAAAVRTDRTDLAGRGDPVAQAWAWDAGEILSS